MTRLKCAWFCDREWQGREFCLPRSGRCQGLSPSNGPRAKWWRKPRSSVGREATPGNLPFSFYATRMGARTFASASSTVDASPGCLSLPAPTNSRPSSKKHPDARRSDVFSRSPLLSWVRVALRSKCPVQGNGGFWLKILRPGHDGLRRDES